MYAFGVDGEVGMTVQDAACGPAAIWMAAQASVRIVRIAGSVWRGDRGAERHVCRDHTAGATGEMAHVAIRLGEVEFDVRPLRVDQRRAVALVAGRQVPAASG